MYYVVLCKKQTVAPTCLVVLMEVNVSHVPWILSTMEVLLLVVVNVFLAILQRQMDCVLVCKFLMYHN